MLRDIQRRNPVPSAPGAGCGAGGLARRPQPRATHLVVDGWRCEAPKLHKQTKKASSELAHAHTRARARATHLGALDGVGVGVLDVARGAGAAVVLVALLSIKAPAPPPPTWTFVLHAGPLTWSETRVGGGVPGLLYQHAGANVDHRCAFESTLLHARSAGRGFPSFVSSCGR